MHLELRNALDRADIPSLAALARLAAYKPQTLHKVACGRLIVSMQMASRLAEHLGINAAQVPSLFKGSR